MKKGGLEKNIVFLLLCIVGTFLLLTSTSNSPTGLQFSDLPPVYLEGNFSTEQGASLVIDLAQYFSDPEGSNLSFAVDDQSIVLEGSVATITPFNAGDHVLTIEVSDGINTIYKPIPITVFANESFVEPNSAVSVPNENISWQLILNETSNEQVSSESSESTSSQMQSSIREIGVQDIGACGDISTSGPHTLDNNVSATGTCFNFTVSNVELDCNGFTITWDTLGGGSDSGVIATTVNNVTVRDCVFVDNNSAGSDGVGVRFLTGTNNSLIVNSSIQTNGTSSAIGVSLDNVSNNNRFENNTIRTSGSSSFNPGFFIFGLSSNNTVFNNSITTNGTAGNHGIEFFNSSSNRALRNAISANGPAASSFNRGVLIQRVENSTVANNIIATNGTTGNYGIDVESNSTNSLIENNTVYTSGTDLNRGIQVYDNVSNSIIRNNTITTSGSAGTNQGIVVTTSALNTTVLNNSVQTGGTIANYGIVVELSSLDTRIENNTIHANGSTTDNTGITLLTSSANTTVVNNTIDARGLSSDNKGIFINVLSSNNTIVNNSITTNGTTGDHGVFILDSFDNDLLRNVIRVDGQTASSFNRGVLLIRAENTSIANNIIATNGSTGNFGINIDTGSNNTLAENNTISTAGSASFNVGIIVFSNSVNTRMVNNSVVTSGTTTNYGFSISDFSNHTLVENNTVRASGSGGSNFGVYVSNSSHFVSRLNNISTVGAGTSNRGFTIETSASNISIVSNVLSVNGTGIAVQSSAGSFFNVTGNVILGTGDGVSIPANDSVVDGNNVTVLSDFSWAITFDGGRNASVTNNFATSQGSTRGRALRFTRFSDGVVVNNTGVVTGAGDSNFGVELVGSNNVQFRNTTVLNSGSGPSSHGVRVNASNVSFDNTVITTSSSSGYGFFVSTNIVSAVNFSNTVFNNTGEWIRTGSGTLSNFTNTTFLMSTGSVLFAGLFSVNSTQEINHTKLNISQNRVFLNSTNLTFMNTTAQITLNSLSFADPRPVVNFSDGSTYDNCSSPQCTEVSYSGGTFIFNVSSFTSYAAAENATVISSCPYVISVTGYHALNQSITAVADCINITASDVTLDCLGNSITFPTGGSTGRAGVVVAATGSGAVIKNCIINKTTSASNSGGVRSLLSTGLPPGSPILTIVNNTISNGTVGVSGGDRTNVSNNTFVVLDNSDGIQLQDYSFIDGNFFSVLGGTVTGSSAVVAQGEQLVIRNNFILLNASKRGIFLSFFDRMNVSNNTIVSAAGSVAPMGIESTGSFHNVSNNVIIFNATDFISGVQDFGFSNIYENNFIQLNGSGGSTGMYAAPASFVNNTIIVTSPVFNEGVNIDGGGIGNISNNTIIVDFPGGSNYGLVLQSDNMDVVNNSISVNGASDLSGIVEHVGGNRFSNNFVEVVGSGGWGFTFVTTFLESNFTNNVFIGTGTGGINFTDSDNNNFVNNSLRVTGAWILTEGSSANNNFTNTSFVTSQGQIKIVPSFIVPMVTEINGSNLNVTFNRAFLNSSNLSFMNLSGEVTLSGLTFVDPRPVVNFTDGSTYENCNSPQCAEVSYSGGAFTFNVSSFTSYAAAENATIISSCPYVISVTGYHALNQSITAVADCINITASDVTLDCLGNSITFPTGGSTGRAGVVVAATGSGAVIKNCIINKTTSASNSRGVRSLLSTGLPPGSPVLTIVNNTISNGTVGISGGDRTNISNNTFVVPDNAAGIQIQDYSFIDGNFFSVLGGTVTGSSAVVAQGEQLVIRNNFILLNASKRGIFLSFFDRMNVSNNTIVSAAGSVAPMGIESTGSFHNVSNNVIIFNATDFISGVQDFGFSNIYENNFIQLNGSGGSTGMYAAPASFVNNTIIVTSPVFNEGVNIDGGGIGNISNNTIIVDFPGGSNYGLVLQSDNMDVVNNSISVNGASDLSGIVEHVGGNRFSNNFVEVVGSGGWGFTFVTTFLESNFTNNVFIGTGTGGINFTDSDNNNFVNNSLRVTGAWILTEGSSANNNFTNTSFVTSQGQIKIVPSFIVPMVTEINGSNLNVTFNRAFLNSSNLSFMNLSGEVTLSGLTFVDPRPVVNFTDGSTYENCNSPQCAEVSYSGGAFTFNVSSFTSYAAAENATIISSCPYVISVTGYHALNQSITAVADCINITASDVTLDCLGNSITFPTGGSTGRAGVVVAATGSGAVIKNCIINKTTSASNSRGVRSLLSTGLPPGSPILTIVNNTISNGTVGISGGDRTNISNNTFVVPDNAARYSDSRL